MQAGRLVKALARLFLGLTAAVTTVSVTPVVHVPQAQAETFDGNAIRERFRRMQQERGQQRDPRRQRAIQELQRGERTTRQPRRTQRARKPAATAVAPQPPAVEKVDDAKVVLVIGDFLAGGLAEGLTNVFREDSNIRVVNRANGSSGFVRDDYFDWPGEIDAILEAEKPAAVVLMIGSNDRQQIKIDGNRYDARSPGWLAEYERRATVLAQALEKRDIPLIWVGMPSFKQSRLTSDMLAYNDIYRSVAEKAEAEFVDIWDGFADENGAFVSTGPDINGQPVRLRGSDGINMTTAGKRKIAFYAERPLRKLLGGDQPAIEPLGPAYAPGAETAPEAITRTVPIALSDPELDGGKELLGAVPPTPIRTTAKPVESGMQAGRADDFGPPPPLPAGATALAPIPMGPLSPLRP